MTRTTCHISISLDGFVAGPDQSRENPIGAGGLRLHQWHQQADEPGHEADIAPRDELMTPRGAYIMGRNMFGPIRGEWDEDWRGLHHLRPRSDPVLPDRRHRVDALRRLPLRGKETYDAEIENPGFQGSPDLRVVRLVEQDDVVMGELIGEVHRVDGSLMRMAMAETWVMRDGLISERRSYTVELTENNYR